MWSEPPAAREGRRAVANEKARDRHHTVPEGRTQDAATPGGSVNHNVRLVVRAHPHPSRNGRDRCLIRRAESMDVASAFFHLLARPDFAFRRLSSFFLGSSPIFQFPGGGAHRLVLARFFLPTLISAWKRAQKAGQLGLSRTGPHAEYGVCVCLSIQGPPRARQHENVQNYEPTAGAGRTFCLSCPLPPLAAEKLAEIATHRPARMRDARPQGQAGMAHARNGLLSFSAVPVSTLILRAGNAELAFVEAGSGP